MRVLVVAAIALMISATARAEEVAAPATSTLAVRGEGRVEVPPDHARLTVEVVTKGKSLDAATAAHRERASRAADALRAMQNVRIERSVFRVDQVRVPAVPATPERFTVEYHAITSFELKLTRMDTVDSAITTIAASGLFEVRNLRFGIDDKNPGLNAARKNAVDDARERAEVYARAAGVQLGAIAKIDEADSRGPREFAVAAPMAGSVQVIPPETLTLSAAVTITWRIGARP